MRIGRIFGIDIIIHISWIFVFALVTWILSSDVGPLQHVEVPPPTRALLGALASLLFFASVLIHELAHSLLARSRGIPVSSITLFIFGGVSSLSSDPQNPGAEGWIALIGPLSSLALALIFGLASSVLGLRSPLGAVAQYLSATNVVLAVFNLLPAMPLDGGRVFHAIVWSKTRNRLRATRTAAGVGRVIASAIIGLGIIQTLFAGFGYGLWLVFVGWFILQAGDAELAREEAVSVLRGLTAADIGVPIAIAIPAGASAAEAFQTLLKFGQSAAPVVLDGKLLGLVSLYDLAHLEPDERLNTAVTAMMKRVGDVVSVAPSTPANEALQLMSSSGHRQLPVVDADGTLRAMITRDALLQRIAMTGRAA